MAAEGNDQFPSLAKYHAVREAIREARKRRDVFFGDAVYILFTSDGGSYLTNLRPPIDIFYVVLPARDDEDQRVRANLFADYLSPSQWLGDVK